MKRKKHNPLKRLITMSRCAVQDLCLSLRQSTREDGVMLRKYKTGAPVHIGAIKAIGSPSEVCIKLENPEANKGLFASRQNKNKAVSVAIAMSVGKVQATTHHIKELLESEGYAVKLITPLKGEVKRQAKANAKYFNKLTGWAGRSNQDQRDAALIALFG